MRMRKPGRKRQQNPWSAKPRLRSIPSRIDAAKRKKLYRRIKNKCARNELGCWIYPSVRDEAYPYLSITGDDGSSEQWSARRFVWALRHGDIPERGIIIGCCPYPQCVNPGHQALWVPPLQMDWVGGL